MNNSDNKTPQQAPREAFSIWRLLRANVVPITFLIICSLGFFFSGLHWTFFAQDLVTRLSRNSILVLSLIIPVLAGLGLNFAIVLGAIAGQFAAFITVCWNMAGLPGFIAACIMSIPFAILFGWMAGSLFNNAKGKEMITGIILGFFANGLYQAVCLLVIGGLIPISPENSAIMLPSGIGLVNTIDLGLWRHALDRANIYHELTAFWPALAGYEFLKYLDFSFNANIYRLLAYYLPGLAGNEYLRLLNFNIPVLTFLIVGVLCTAVNFLFKTKLGQDLRAAGQNRHIAEVAGIRVNRVRIIAIIFSMVLSAWGQLIFLQNLGNVQVYGSHVQVGMVSVAAILIGGATVSRATITQVLVGTTLFHALFIVSPFAGSNLMGSAQIGEFFRVFVAYGVIGLALALHAWQRKK